MSRYLQVDFLLSGLRDSSGRSLAGGKVHVYLAGTSTEVALYSDATGATAHVNPIILDSRGAKEAYGNGNYKFIIRDSNDVLQYTWDNKEYAKSEDSTIYSGTSTGSSNNYAVSPSPAISALADGDVVTFIANHASTGAATLNTSGLGVKNFVRIDGTTALGIGDILSSQLVDARWVTSSDHYRLVSQAGVAAIASGGTGASTAAAARTNLGLGTIATQAASAVAITGGTITGITDLALADGGTGASTAADARTNLGIGAGTMATQSASAVAITGGTATFSTMIATTVEGLVGSNLGLNARTGRTISFSEEGVLKASIPSGTSSGSCVFAVDVNNNYILGQGSFAFQNIHTYGVSYKNPFNFNNTGFAYTTRTSLNPAAATASNVADYVLTLVEKLSLGAGVSFTP